MVKAIALAWSIAAVGAASFTPAGEVTLRDLTVPDGRLPEGCALLPAAAAPLYPIRTNPWVGTDAPIIASIRERIEGPIVVPDPPALTVKGMSAFRLHLAEGVAEAYAAVYTQAESGSVVVYGVRFTGAEQAVDPASGARRTRSPRIIRVTIGSIVAMVNGDGGPCFQAVGAYLKSVAN
jgi:hypothetical protein